MVGKTGEPVPGPPLIEEGIGVLTPGVSAEGGFTLLKFNVPEAEGREAVGPEISSETEERND